jgi:hypothetical protein
LAAERYALVAVAIGEEAEVTDAHEAARQNVQQEPSQELVSGQGHLALLVAVGIILPAERNVAIGKREQTVIGDRDTMGIAGEVVEDMLWPSKWPLGIDHPVPPEERAKKLLEQFGAS